MKMTAKEPNTEQIKQKRGRPKKAITRSISLVVRITPIERMLIEGKAKNAGLQISDWFRQSAKTSVIRPRLSKEEAGFLRMMSGIANNLNQLTKLAHKSGLVSLSVDLRRSIREIGNLMERIGKDDS
ncbi:plasmid mobilization relaxosome protein MobC [Sphingobacterium oryzagri]|uniref:Plasmid mobilization relaxosome protein MobC n=1 Tax=Sphingobacterium oryzagri TaxID=3025669 RepID=A0ABY7WLS2_9SPHI|nr:plasmid mobilization relaxosome protein MobC [Sphingobacterium sp. KACC 22765]WDF69597.1 plasmid mobilization relaxosome protein MobC [Sphingobacterium sp. KACC 22765]